MKKSLLIIELTIAFLLIAQINYAQEEEFPYTAIDWSSFRGPHTFTSDGNLVLDGSSKTDLEFYLSRPYQFLESFVSNPDAEADYYMAKISSDQNLEFVKLYGPLPKEPHTPYGRFEGKIRTDEENNIYKIGSTSAEEGISTPDAYTPNYYENWSDPYEMYVELMDLWVTIPPELCLDAFIMKFDPQGEQLWGSYYNGNQNIEFVQSFVKGGYVYLYGQTTSYEGIATPGTFVSDWGSEVPQHEPRYFMLKIDAQTGTPVWGTYLLTDQEELVGVPSDFSLSSSKKRQGLVVTSEGYIVYYLSDTVRILSPDGSLYNEFNPHIPGGVYALETDKTNNFYLNGMEDSPLDSESIGTEDAYKPNKTTEKEFFMTKFSIQGEKLWGTYLFEVPFSTDGGNYDDINIGFQVDKNDVYFAGSTPEVGLATEGAFQTEIVGGVDIAFGKLDGANGSLKWMSYYGGSGDDKVLDMVIDQDDNLYISGITNSPSEEVISENALFSIPIYGVVNGFELFAVKFLHQKNLSIEKQTEREVMLYPNPTRNKITLQGKTPFSEKARLVVYDLLGRKIMSHPVQPSTTQEVDVANLSNGVYFLSIEENGNKEFHRFVKE